MFRNRTRTSDQKSYKDQIWHLGATITNWLKKDGNFEWENQTPSNIPKPPEQKIMELEAQGRFLEKQKAFFEQQAFVVDMKAIIFDMMIDIAEKKYQIDTRKNSSPAQSTTLKYNKNKQQCLPVLCSGWTAINTTKNYQS